MRKPLIVVFHHGLQLLGLGDRMAESLVYDHPYRQTTVLERLVEFIPVGNWYSLVELSVLNQRRSLRGFNVSDGRRFFVDIWVVPRSRLQILPGERMDIGIHVIGHPVADPRPDGDRLEPIAERRNEGRNVSALTPAHGANASFVD